MSRLRQLVLSGLLCACPSVARAADPPAADYEMTDVYDYVALEHSESVTSASKEEGQASLAPSIIQVISRAEIEIYGYRSVAEALASVPGLYLIDDHVQASVGLRGIHGGADSWSRVIKVLIDGRPATYHANGGNFLGPEFIPMDLVDSIEVIRGPGSALYGANALLGVVNVKTRAPSGDLAWGMLGGDAGFVAGNPSWSANFSSEVSLAEHGSITIGFSRGHYDRSGLSVPDDSPAAGDFESRESENDLAKPRALVAIGHFVSWLGRLTLEVIDQRVDSRANFTAEGILDQKTRVVKENRIFGVALERDIGVVTVRGYGRHYIATEPEENLTVRDLGGIASRTREAKTSEVGLEVASGWHGHLALAGADYTWYEDRGDQLFDLQPGMDGSLDSGNRVTTVVGDDLQYTNLGLYGQVIVRPLPWLSFTGGLRYDINDRWGNELSVRLGAVSELGDHAQAKLLYGTSFLPPSPAQLNAVPVLFFGGITGNPDLETQRADTVELGMSYQPMASMNLQLNTFYVFVADRIEFIGQGNHAIAQNITDSHSVGGELVGEWLFFGGRAFVKNALSIQATWQDTPDVERYWWTLTNGEGKYESPGFPMWMDELSTGLVLPDYHVMGALTLRGVSRRKSSVANIVDAGDVYYLPAYATVDFNIRSKGLNLLGDNVETRVQLHVTNLFDADIAEPGTKGVDTPGTGRSAFVQLQQEW